MNYYSLNSRLKEEPAHMMKASRMSSEGMWQRGGFSRQEIKQNIQYSVICEHNFDAVFEVIERETCHFVCSVKNKHKAAINIYLYTEAIPFSLISHELLFTDVSFV